MDQPPQVDNRPRRRRSATRLIDEPRTAQVIAGQLAIRIEQLRFPGENGHNSGAAKTADNDLADLLNAVVNELRTPVG